MQRRCVLPLIRLITFRGGVQTTETVVSLCPSQKSQYTGRYWPRADGNGYIINYIHSITILYSILVFTSQSLLLLLLSMYSRSIVITSRTLASWRVMIRVIRTCNANLEDRHLRLRRDLGLCPGAAGMEVTGSTFASRLERWSWMITRWLVSKRTGLRMLVSHEVFIYI